MGDRCRGLLVERRPGWAAVRVAIERLGHSDVQITMDVYSHVIEGLQRDAAEGIAALIRPPPVANDSDAETPSLDETTSAEAREAERLS